MLHFCTVCVQEKLNHFSLQEGEDIFSLSAKAEFQENCNSRLVDILREENTTLKRDLETYYQRVRKLQKVSALDN